MAKGENVRWEGGCVGRALIQQDSSHPSDSVFYGRGNLAIVATTLVPTAKSTSIVLSKEVEKEVEHNEGFFLELGLIGRFVGRWSSLGDLHKWISVHWEPSVEDYVQIYPHARGFFVVVFQSVADRNKVLGGGQWCWEDKHVLMLKPWHPTFNPDSESFDQMPLWIRLLNLPMQYWFDLCFEAVGNSLGTFLMTDEDSLNLLHTTFARLLVMVDVTMGLPSEISITSSKGSWLQSLDYEGIPFRWGDLFSDKGLDPTINLQRVVSGLGCAINGGSPLGGSSPHAGCASEQKMEGVVAELKLEDGSVSHGDFFVGFREGHHAIQKMDYAGFQNLKLLKNAQADGWIEVKQKKGKKGLFGSVCISLLLEGGGVPREVAP
ncbi:hypothetical protein SUGI_0010790 [Cryptomeria japonica]|nr:hypothetical protein SUGI_0010790 [Cryptomeria japonica]